MSLRRYATFAIVLSAVLLAGCHSAKVLLPPNLRPPSEHAGDALKQAREKLQQATPCCSSFADFSYRNMLPWQPQKFTLGSNSMVANLDGTQSYFLAFRLPSEAAMPYRVAMKSELSGRWLHSSYLFAPTIVLLDEGFQPLRSEDINLCEHMGWSNETSGAFGSVKVEEPQARYLLVYSSAKQQSGKTYWEQSPASISNTSAAATLQMNSTGSFSIPHGPDGSVWVGMMNKTFEKAIDNAICKKATKGNGEFNNLRNALPLPWKKNKNTQQDGADGSNKPAAGKSP